MHLRHDTPRLQLNTLYVVQSMDAQCAYLQASTGASSAASQSGLQVTHFMWLIISTFTAE